MVILGILSVILAVCITFLWKIDTKDGKYFLFLASLVIIVTCFTLVPITPINGIPLQDKSSGEYKVLGVMTVEGINPEKSSVVVLLSRNNWRHNYTVEIRRADIEGEILIHADQLEVWESGNRKMYRFK